MNMNIGMIFTLLTLAKPLISLLFKLPGWVREAQAAHGTEDGAAKLREVTQKAMDWYEAAYGEVNDDVEAVIVQVVAWAVDIALDMFKKEKAPEFVKDDPVEDGPAPAPMSGGSPNE